MSFYDDDYGDTIWNGNHYEWMTATTAIDNHNNDNDSVEDNNKNMSLKVTASHSSSSTHSQNSLQRCHTVDDLLLVHAADNKSNLGVIGMINDNEMCGYLDDDDDVDMLSFFLSETDSPTVTSAHGGTPLHSSIDGHSYGIETSSTNADRNRMSVTDGGSPRFDERDSEYDEKDDDNNGLLTFDFSYNKNDHHKRRSLHSSVSSSSHSSGNGSGGSNTRKAYNSDEYNTTIETNKHHLRSHHQQTYQKQQDDEEEEEEEDDNDDNLPHVWSEESINRLMQSTIDPVGKFLKSLNISAASVLELQLMEMLQVAPKKKREKYGTRRVLTTEERRYQSRMRNKEHAHATRLRKKVFTQVERKLQHLKLVSSVTQPRNEFSSNSSINSMKTTSSTDYIHNNNDSMRKPLKETIKSIALEDVLLSYFANPLALLLDTASWVPTFLNSQQPYYTHPQQQQQQQRHHQLQSLPSQYTNIPRPPSAIISKLQSSSSSFYSSSPHISTHYHIHSTIPNRYNSNNNNNHHHNCHHLSGNNDINEVVTLEEMLSEPIGAIEIQIEGLMLRIGSNNTTKTNKYFHHDDNCHSANNSTSNVVCGKGEECFAIMTQLLEQLNYDVSLLCGNNNNNYNNNDSCCGSSTNDQFSSSSSSSSSSSTTNSSVLSSDGRYTNPIVCNGSTITTTTSATRRMNDSILSEVCDFPTTNSTSTNNNSNVNNYDRNQIRPTTIHNNHDENCENMHQYNYFTNDVNSANKIFTDERENDFIDDKRYTHDTDGGITSTSSTRSKNTTSSSVGRRYSRLCLTVNEGDYNHPHNHPPQSQSNSFNPCIDTTTADTKSNLTSSMILVVYDQLGEIAFRFCVDNSLVLSSSSSSPSSSLPSSSLSSSSLPSSATRALIHSYEQPQNHSSSPLMSSSCIIDNEIKSSSICCHFFVMVYLNYSSLLNAVLLSNESLSRMQFH